MNKNSKGIWGRHAAVVTTCCAVVALAGCGGGSASSVPPPRTYSLGGAISGLSAAGLVLANGSASLSVASGASAFTLPAALSSGSAYDVTVATQPAGEDCTVSNGAGTMPAAAVTGVMVSCSSVYSLGGTVSGLSGSGLVLANGSDSVKVASGASSFVLGNGVVAGASYDVTVKAQPIGETCVVMQGAGTMPAASVSTVAVSCSVNTYAIGGTISGLGSASGLVLLDNGTDSTPIASGATSFTMTTQLKYGATYDVSIGTQPYGLTLQCVASGGSGSVAGTVTSISLDCATVTPVQNAVVTYLSSPAGVAMDSAGNLFGLFVKSCG